MVFYNFNILLNITFVSEYLKIDVSSGTGSYVKMSVQNLREKFNQPSNGTPPPPGTSFGAPKLHSKQELFIPRTESATSAKTGSCSFISSNNGKLCTQLHTRLRNTESLSLDRQNNGSKTYTNGCTEPVKNQRKSPEQSQQDIILRKWNRTSVSPDSNKTEKPNTITTKAKNSVLRYVSQVALDEKMKNFDKQTDSTLSEQTSEILKRAKPENSVNNVQLPDNDTCDNNSSSDNSIRVKMNAGHKAHTQNNPHLISSGSKKSSVVERWKVAQEESEAKKFSLPKGKIIFLLIINISVRRDIVIYLFKQGSTGNIMSRSYFL